MSDRLREAARKALAAWDEYETHECLRGWMDILRAALTEPDQASRLLGIVADLAAWREFSSLDHYDLADAAVRLMDEIEPDWRADYEESNDD